jgi:hypothetical protein
MEEIEIDYTQSSIFDWLSKRQQFGAIDKILDYLTPTELANLRTTSKTMRVLCDRKINPWLAPGPREEPCPNYAVDQKLWMRCKVWRDLLWRFAITAATLTLIGSGGMTLFSVGADIGWVQLWNRLTGTAEALPSARWAKILQLAREMGGLTPLLIGGFPTALLALGGHLLQKRVQISEFWVGQFRPPQMDPAFSRLDDRNDWTEVERRGLLSGAPTRKAKFLHHQRQQLYVAQEFESGGSGYLHPLYRYYIELHYNGEFARFFGGLDTHKSEWRKAALAIEEANIRPYWDRQPLVDRRIDCAQYGHDRLALDRQLQLAQGLPRYLRLEIGLTQGISLATTALAFSIIRPLIIPIWQKITQDLLPVTASPQLVAGLVVGIPSGTVLAMPAIYLQCWLIIRANAQPLATLLEWLAKRKVAHLKAKWETMRYPDIDFEDDSFEVINAAVDWQRVNTWGLMERNLVQMAAAWSVELQEAQEKGVSAATLRRLLDGINRDFARARDLVDD